MKLDWRKSRLPLCSIAPETPDAVGRGTSRRNTPCASHSRMREGPPTISTRYNALAVEITLSMTASPSGTVRRADSRVSSMAI